MSTARDEEDDDALPLEEQYSRPVDEAVHQQRVKAWHPILDPVWVIIALFYLAVILIPVGYKIQELANDIVEYKVTYDGIPNASCGIGRQVRAGRECTEAFRIEQTMHPPILVYYELTNFHQNHRNYYQSRDVYQLFGQLSSEQDTQSRTACEPLNQLRNTSSGQDIYINPCGLIANTFFNDIFTLVRGRSARTGIPLVMEEEGIAWQSDLEYMYQQPNGFCYEPCPNGGCGEDCCTPSPALNTTTCGHPNRFSEDDVIPWSCETPYRDSSDDTCYRYYYPEDNVTQYLYETYPEVINPIEGVTNEHFVVWMRVATLPTFRKLYGYITEPIGPNTTIHFNITSNYVVESFGGTKSLILTTNNIFGGKSYFMATSFIGVGFFCLLAGTFFALKHIVRPRRLGDKMYLHYKQE